MNRDGRRALPIQTDEVTVALDGGFLIDTMLDGRGGQVGLSAREKTIALLDEGGMARCIGPLIRS